MNREGRSCRVIRAGIVSHEAVDNEMKRLAELRESDKVGDTLILVEHPEVVTIGRRAQHENTIVPQGFDSRVVDRGGGLTWHGPRQLVIYPVFRWDLEGENKVESIINALEEWVITAFGKVGVFGERNSLMQGVWVEGRKIVSIGLAFKRWVTRHGMTINMATPPERLAEVEGCGLAKGVSGSLLELGHEISRNKMEQALLSTMEISLARFPAEIIEKDDMSLK